MYEPGKGKADEPGVVEVKQFLQTGSVSKSTSKERQ
jgi:hypothetical protein